jgi:UDP-3-O-[3-hydroxymyristoyl] N-acetylglucosamine deacetylase
LIDATRRQQTIGRPVVVSGFGYWSGRDISLEFRPAEVNTGYVFVRRDQPGRTRIAACLANRIQAPRRTSLCCAGAQVDMVEHVLAALAGLEIDNCEIWADASEMPGCDGSALPFVTALETAGLVRQDAARLRKTVLESIRCGGADGWIEASPLTGRRPVFRYDLDYGNSPIGQQSYRLVLTPEAFRKQLAPARTFLLESEAQRLLAQGKGCRATTRDLLVYGPQGPIDNAERFPDECARHKIVDMIGDFSLLPFELAGCFHACRSGHRLNAELIAAVLTQHDASTPRRCA